MKVKGLSGDAKISLLNGTEKRLCDLTDDYTGEPIFLYTIANHRLNVGVAWSPKYYGKSETLIVKLDSGDEILCSPNQKLLLRDGSIKKAKKLDPGQSLMPLYRDITTKGFLKGYERVFRTERSTPSYAYTHQIVGKWKFGKRYEKNNGLDLHHIDFNKSNNDPTNIDLLFRIEHREVHEKKPRMKYRNDMDFIKSYRDRRLPHPPGCLNHSIVSIEKGPREQLYSLVVMDTEIFALSDGIFVVGF
jgi:DNA gyrase subunit B